MKLARLNRDKHRTIILDEKVPDVLGSKITLVTLRVDSSRYFRDLRAIWVGVPEP